MKFSLSRIILLLLLSAAGAIAQMQDVQISATRLKLDETKERPGGPVTITTKEIVYKVTVQNKTFKTLSDIEVKYMIFYEVPHPGTNEKPSDEIHKGSGKLTSIEGNRSATFDTTPIKLSAETLDGGWVYSGGVSHKTKDRVTGVWFRAYAGGKLIGEYANPTTVAKRNDWKE